MSQYWDMLGSGESLFKNEDALDFEFLPKIIQYRENEQQYVRDCIMPLIHKRNGKNLFISGAPGIGKTAAIRHVLNSLEDEDVEDVIPVYINCWQKNTSFKIVLEICDQIGYRLTHNKKTDELFRIIKQHLNKKAVVFAFDEVDKVEDLDFLYNILEEIYKKSIFIITNFKDWVTNLDMRIRSRIMLEHLEFRPYNQEETLGIIKQRIGYAFIDGAWEADAIEEVSKKTFEMHDLRTGLHLLRQAGLVAEAGSLKKITSAHVAKVIEKSDDFSIKKSDDLEEETRRILGIIKNNPDKKIGDLFRIYQDEGGKAQYKTFQRKIKKLEQNKFISAERIVGGAKGSTTIINASSTKKLTDF